MTEGGSGPDDGVFTNSVIYAMPSPCRSHSTCQADLQSFANFPFPPPHRVDGNRDSVNCRDTLMLELWFCGCVCLCMYLPMESLQRRVSANASMLLCSPPQCQPLVVWHGWSWWSCVLVKWQGSRPWMGEIKPQRSRNTANTACNCTTINKHCSTSTFLSICPKNRRLQDNKCTRFTTRNKPVMHLKCERPD